MEKYYQIVGGKDYSPTHLAKDEEGRTLCGYNWKYNLMCDIIEFKNVYQIQKTGCKKCIAIFKNENH